MGIRKSDMLCFICNECAKKDKKRVFLLPPEMQEENVEAPIYCPFCGIGDTKARISRDNNVQS